MHVQVHAEQFSSTFIRPCTPTILAHAIKFRFPSCRSGAGVRVLVTHGQNSYQ